MNDEFLPYEVGLRRLLEQLDKENPRYADALVFQQRLLENITSARKYGDTDTLSAGRARVVDSLNRLAQELLGMAFNELCQSASEQLGRVAPVSPVSAPKIVDIYSSRQDWFDLPGPSYVDLSCPSPRSPKLHEWLYSNLLPVWGHPSILYSAPSPHRSRDEVRALLHDTYKPPFILKEKRLWTFADLTKPDCPLRRACDVNDIKQTNCIDWWHDDSRRLWLVDLYNQCLRRKCFSLGLLYDWQHNRFYFAPDGERDRAIEYQASKRRARRRVAYFYRSWFWVHQAARLSFVFILDQWYLKVEPAYTFTKDGVEFLDSRQVGPLSTKRKARDYNLNVFNHLVFWREYLSSGRDDISVLCGDQEMVISKFYERGEADFGIPADHAKLLEAEPLEPDIGEELFEEPPQEGADADLERDEDDADIE